jgi:hypothetical protein
MISDEKEKIFEVFMGVTCAMKKEASYSYETLAQT